MKISIRLDNLLDDLEDFEPATLTDIVRFVRVHEDLRAITMLIQNSKKSSTYFTQQCDCLIEEENSISDVQLAGLLVVAAEIEGEMYDELMSRASLGAGNYHWSQGMATSYLLHKEVTSERIRKSA